MEVGLLFRTDFGEQWSLSTAEHPKLVEMVNDVKTEATGAPGGAFYINEYRQVIVPSGDGSDVYYFAGEYHQDLDFLFEGQVISSRAIGSDGKRLKPGDAWQGVHPGIPYVLKAGAKDVYFERSPRPNVKRKELLSKHTTATDALAFAARVRSIKGFEGGRFYVNERRHIFAPLNADGGMEYLYIGDLPKTDPWYPKWKPEIADDE